MPSTKDANHRQHLLTRPKSYLRFWRFRSRCLCARLPILEQADIVFSAHRLEAHIAQLTILASTQASRAPPSAIHFMSFPRMFQGSLFRNCNSSYANLLHANQFVLRQRVRETGRQTDRQTDQSKSHKPTDYKLTTKMHA